MNNFLRTENDPRNPYNIAIKWVIRFWIVATISVVLWIFHVESVKWERLEAGWEAVGYERMDMMDPVYRKCKK